MKSVPLAPTLWRTCRVLANVSRLRLLQEVLKAGRTSVSEAAQRADVGEVPASLGLRALQARGLLALSREGRWVCYTARADPAVAHAEAVLEAMRQAWMEQMSPERAIEALTAFTHPRRLILVRTIHEQPQSAERLSAACQISLPAVYRHLRKLADREIVTFAHEDHCVLLRPPNRLANDLLMITLLKV